MLPALGNLPLTAVSRADVVRMCQDMKATPGAANRTLQLLNDMLNAAEKWVCGRTARTPAALSSGSANASATCWLTSWPALAKR